MVFLLSFATFSNAQPYLLVEDRGSIRLLDYTSVDLKYQCVRSDIDIELTKSYGYNLVGYHWDNDSLVLHLEKRGMIENRKVSIDRNLNIFKREIAEELNLVALWKNTFDREVKYKCGNYTVIVNTAEGVISCFENDRFLWRIKNEIRVTGSGFTSEVPVFSLRRKTLLFQYAVLLGDKLVEIDILTGNKTYLVNNTKGTLFDYSNDGNYVLFYNRKKRVSIYDVNKKKAINFLGWKNAFWLYK